MDSPDRVSMKVSIFSPDGKNFCQFMTPNVPKPRFLTQFHPGMDILFFQKWHLALGPTQGLGPWDPFGGARWGPWDPFGGGSSGRPKADIMEAEGRLNGGLGAKPPGIMGPIGPIGPGPGALFA